MHIASDFNGSMRIEEGILPGAGVVFKGAPPPAPPGRLGHLVSVTLYDASDDMFEGPGNRAGIPRLRGRSGVAPTLLSSAGKEVRS